MVRRAGRLREPGTCPRRHCRAGYLFGEILNCYHFQPDFSQFMDDFTPNAKVRALRLAFARIIPVFKRARSC